MLDLGIVKKDFRSLVGNVHPSTLSHFIMWLDIKVAEYKVYGHMVLDETSNDTPTWLRVQRLFEPKAASNSGDESWTQSEATANKQIRLNVSSHYQTSEQQSDGIPQRHAADGQPCRSLHSLTRHTNNHGLEIEHDLSPACRNLNNYTTGHKDHEQIDERGSEQEMLPNNIMSQIQLQDRCTQEIDRSVKHAGVIDFHNAGHEVQSNKISRSTIVLNEYSHSEDELQKRLTLEAEQESSAKNNTISSEVLDENVIKIELSSDEESQTGCLSTQQGEIPELICDTGQDQMEIRKMNFDPKDFSLQESNLREVSEDMSPVPQSLFRINDKSPVKGMLEVKDSWKKKKWDYFEKIRKTQKSSYVGAKVHSESLQNVLPFPNPFPLHNLTYGVSAQQMIHSGIITRPGKMQFLDTVFNEVVKYTGLYPTLQQKTDVAKAIVTTFPKLEQKADPVDGSAIDQWLVILNDKFRNERRMLHHGPYLSRYRGLQLPLSETKDIS